MALPFSAPRFALDGRALTAVVAGIKLVECPHCRRVGALIRHGFLRGYAEQGSDVEVRGRRVFCSNRGRRPGCGRTFSVTLATVLAGFVVRTVTLWNYAKAVLSGLTRRAAWRTATDAALSLSSGYRLWRRLYAAQSALRARLCREAPAPASTAREPLAQLLTHLILVVGDGASAAVSDAFAAYQVRVQQGLFDT